MPYIGHSPEVAQRRYESVDDISGSFDGSTTSFALQVGGVTPAPFPVASENVLISVGGVIQEPDGTGTNGFQLTGTNIVFSSAPAAGQSFFGVILAGADYVTAGHAFPDGDAAGPSITFSQDLDTGVFRAASGAIGFGGNGSEHARLDGSGRLLVGNPTARTNVVDGDGGNTLTPQFQFETANDDTAKALSVIFGRNNSNGAEIVLGKHRSASVGGTTIVSDGDQLGSLTFSGSDGTNFRPAATIEANVDATPGSSDMPGRLTFATTDDGSAVPTERLRITSTGKIGVGENDPQKFVHVSDAGSSNVVTARFQQSTTNTSTDGGSLLELGGTRSDGTYGFYGGIKGGRRNSASDNKGYLAFFSDNNDGQSLAERMRLDDSGRLMIGNDSTANQGLLCVRGNASDSTGGGQITLQRGQSVSGSDQHLGDYNFGEGSANTAKIRAFSGASWTGSSRPTYIIFQTTPTSSGSPTDRMRISEDGTLRVQGVYDNTLSSSANVHVDSGGLIRRVTSSAKYKTNIETIEDSYADALLNCRPVWYQSTCKGDNPDYGWWGFIAEEVAEIDPRLVHWKTTNVTYDEDGRAVEAPCDPEAEGVLYDRFVPHLLNLVKRQKTRIETLETQNTAQQTQIDDLLARVTALEAA